jgi:hypothetical protein
VRAEIAASRRKISVLGSASPTGGITASARCRQRVVVEGLDHQRPFALALAISVVGLGLTRQLFWGQRGGLRPVVPCKSLGIKPRATMTDDPSLDDHAPRGRAQTPGERSAAASAEAGATARPARAEAAPTLSSPPRSLLDLADEATRVAVPNPSRPDSKIIVATGHRGPALVKIPTDGAAIVDYLTRFVLSGSRAWAGADSKTQSNQPHAPRPTAVLLSCRPKIGWWCGRVVVWSCGRVVVCVGSSVVGPVRSWRFIAEPTTRHSKPRSSTYPFPASHSDHGSRRAANQILDLVPIWCRHDR